MNQTIASPESGISENSRNSRQVIERPILFSGSMVRAMLRGVSTLNQPKTQTRRVVKPQPVPCGIDGCDGKHWIWKCHHTELNALLQYRGLMWHQCPYGQPGDRLWVKETWATSIACDDRPPSDMEKPGRGYGWPVWYSADDWINPRGRPTVEGGLGFTTKGKTRPSIFMPRWASRITLEIVAVRVERLQDISEADALAEGVDIPSCRATLPVVCPDCGCQSSQNPGDRCIRDHKGCRGIMAEQDVTARRAYEILWESINGPGSWAKNQWVWVVSFKRVDGSELMVDGKTKTSAKTIPTIN